MKRNALWCVRTRNFSAVIKIPSVCHRNFFHLLLTCQLRFQVHNFCVNLHGFRFCKTVHISQDVICWQSWSKNYSKYEQVRQIYTIYYGRTGCSRANWPICSQQIAMAFAGYTATAKC